MRNHRSRAAGHRVGGYGSEASGGCRDERTSSAVSNSTSYVSRRHAIALVTWRTVCRQSSKHGFNTETGFRENAATTRVWSGRYDCGNTSDRPVVPGHLARTRFRVGSTPKSVVPRMSPIKRRFVQRIGSGHTTT